MATSANFFKRIFTRTSSRKNPDWARVEEPDRFDVLVLSLIGIVFTGFLVLLAQFALTNDLIELTARYLASFDNGMTFSERLAAFGAGLIVFINLFITVVFVVFAQVGNDDIVEMISDMDANTQERIVELENTMSEWLQKIAGEQ